MSSRDHSHRPLPLCSVGVLLLSLAAPAVAADKPLKVFILAGQSNMQGHASVSTFDSLADDPKTAPLLKVMRGPDGKPRVCEKVWITSVGCLGDAYSDLKEAKGKLTAGFGAPQNKIGPEFTFGLTMEKQLNEPVLIIKTSWGGRSCTPTSARPVGDRSSWQRKLRNCGTSIPMVPTGFLKPRIGPNFMPTRPPPPACFTAR